MKRILIVEDNEDMRILYKRMFRNEKEISIAEAERGEAAWEMIPELSPDLMIIDISLPGMNGLELTGKVHERYPDIKILIVTAHELSRYYDEAIRCGADDLVSKEIGNGLIGKCMKLLA